MLRLALAAITVLATTCGRPASAGRRHLVPTDRNGLRSSAAPPPSPSAADFDDPVAVAADDEGRVWVANYRSDTLLGFDAADLMQRRGAVHASPTRSVSTPGGPNQIAIDRMGWLWLADWDANTVSAYRPPDLASPSPRRAVVLSGPEIGSPTDLAFDHGGNLWVANQATGRILEYGARQIRHTGSPRPLASLALDGAGKGTPEAIAFDRNGRLWISDYYRDRLTVVGPDALQGNGPVTPLLEIRLPARTFPIGLTFDRAGRLWMAGARAIVVFRVDPHRATDVAMRLAGPDVVMPHDVSFDSRGAAWVPCYNDTVLRFSAAALHAGRARPDLVLT